MAATMHGDHPATRRNLELKVEVTGDGLERTRRRIGELAGDRGESLHQEDVYLAVPEGRLKLRTITDDSGRSRAELISYRRPDVDGSRWSDYRITPMDAPQARELADTLAHVLQVLVRVRKYREVHQLGATRVHLDEVDDLGAFVELETVITSQDESEARDEHQRAIDQLALNLWPVRAESYSDLLLQRREA